MFERPGADRTNTLAGEVQMIPDLLSRVSVFLVVLALAACPLNAKPKKGKPVKPAKEVVEEAVWPSPLDPGKLDAKYQELSFGKDRDAFLALFEQKLKDEGAPLLKATLDPVERDRLKAQMEKSTGAVKDSWTEFKNQDSGYKISIIAKDFKNFADEGVIRHIYGRSTAYFMFSGGKLWKLALCLGDGEAFQDLVKRLIGFYGNPREIKEAENGQAQAIWSDGTFQVIAEPPPGILRCNQLRFIFKPMLKEVETRRAEAEAGNKGVDPDSDMKKVTSESGEEVDDILDRMLKKKAQPPAPVPVQEPAPAPAPEPAPQPEPAAEPAPEPEPAAEPSTVPSDAAGPPDPI